MSFFLKLLNLKKRFEKPFETLNNIYISEEAILNNFDVYKNLHPNWSVFPVLKSNAYGHGIRQVAKILCKRDLDYICVDSFFEALKINEVNKTPILLIGYTLPSNLKNIDFSFVSLTVYDMDTLDELIRLGRQVKIHLKIDTGMNRQGIFLSELPSYLEKIKDSKNVTLEGLMTHFSDADSIDNDYSLYQENEFKKAYDMIRLAGFQIKYVHGDNSAASAKNFCRVFANASRLGISLYGVNPFELEDPSYESLKSLKLALSFESTLILKKQIKKGEKVSYNGTFTAPTDMTIGIVPVGYYEALSRKLSNNYSYYAGDRRLPIIGRICMNLTVVDISGSGLNVGDKIDIIGTDAARDNNVYELARRSETITYECFTRISETIRRTVR